MSLLTVRDLTLRRDDRTIVEGVSFSVARGTCVALMGPSGTGKSTVLRAVAGLDAPAGGTIVVDGVVGIVFQFHHLFAHKTALENVWLAPVHVHGHARADAERRATALLAQLGVQGRAGAYPHELSGGEAQRVAIARALAMDPSLLLMDEPTASLDTDRRDELAHTVRHLTAEGRTVLVATHDVDFARGVATRAIVLADGRVARDGPVG